MKSLIMLLVLFFLSNSFAKNVCDSAHILKENNNIIIDFEGMRRIKINHNVDGWAISKSGKWLVVYGLPTHIEKQFPQTTYLSIYKNIKTPRMIKIQSFGGGIFEVKFDIEEKNIFINEKRNIYRINTNTLELNSIGFNVDLESEVYNGSCN